MKKGLLLLSVLLMLSCGDIERRDRVEAQPPSDSSTGVVVNIVDSFQLDSVMQAAAPAATKLRLVISNTRIRLEETGRTYKKIIDGDYVNPLYLEFPIANGYVFELVTYYPDTVKPAGTTTVKRMLKYAKATVDITENTNEVTLTLQPITATFTISDPVTSGDLLNTSATFQSPTPLQTSWKLFQSISEILYAQHALSGGITNHTGDKALIVSSSGVLCVQGEFFINTALLDTTGTLTILDTDTPPNVISHTSERSHEWTLNYPNPDFGDPSYCVTLNLVPVAINF